MIRLSAGLISLGLLTGAGAAAIAAPPRFSGVRTCTGSHFDRHAIMCRSADTSITLSGVARAWVTATGTHLSRFTSNRLEILLSRKDAYGTYGEVGRSGAPVSLTYNVIGWRLADVFTYTGASVRAGSYRIEVDEGNTLLGVSSFTLR